MFTKDIKQKTRRLLEGNSESGIYLPGILLNIIPIIILMITIIVLSIISRRIVNGNLFQNISMSIVLFIFMYVSLWFVKFSTNIKKSIISKQ